MDWTDPGQATLVVGFLVGLVWPLVMQGLRRIWPGLDDGAKWQKLAVALLSAFVVGCAAAQGTIEQRMWAGLMAAVASQGTYNVARVSMIKED